MKVTLKPGDVALILVAIAAIAFVAVPKFESPATPSVNGVSGVVVAAKTPTENLLLGSDFEGGTDSAER